LTAFISHKIRQYQLMNKNATTGRSNYSEQELYVGGELGKRQGNLLHYDAFAQVGMTGKAIGQFDLKGNLDLNFHLWNDTVSFLGRASISNVLPSFYMRNYHSTHFWWDNVNSEKEFRTRIEGELNIERWNTNLKAGVATIKNYTYFNQKALPTQYSENVQIVSAGLSQNFHAGIFHLENEISWQKSGNSAVIPLPDLSLYHNFYLQTQLAKGVLRVQLGADVRYFTKYKALTYTPAIQQFHLQATENQTDVGGYPIVNVYANLHLKRTRFFVMMYHVNQGTGNSNYFLAPHYPLNGSLLKFGLSWNFYD
ncbi:hypothetical protein EZS27_034766, partial [termite gut metagenome]